MAATHKSPRHAAPNAAKSGLGGWLLALAAIALAGCAAAPTAPSSGTPSAQLSDATGVPGVTAERLTPGYWIARLDAPGAPVLDAAQIAAQNARLTAQDPSVADMAALPASLSAAEVRARIEAISAPPSRTLFDGDGREVPATRVDALLDALALDAIADEVAPRFGLVTRRADLRTFPTAQRVFSRRGDTDIDRFQESALFPGTPVAVLHASRDGQWWFVASRLYSAWIEADRVALGERDEVLGFAAQPPWLVVTGAGVRTVFTPEAPQASDLALDMGLRLPLIADWPRDKAVNGQFAYASHVVALPARDAQGALEIVPALVPRSADVHTDYLPLTRANLITQAFKFLGERYGWGHSYGTRDCSGFVSEVYRSFGVELPRNTRDQGVSTAFDRIAFTEADDHAARMAVLRNLEVGDLVYIPGHVMMVIGREDGEVWLIHDTTGMRYRDGSGAIVTVPLNQVAVTPLFALLGDSGTPYVDFIYSIQRIRATPSR